MQAITIVGLDIAKSVFQVHGVDAADQVIIHRQLKRRYVMAFFQKLQPCLVGIEACASSHHWSRELCQRRSKNRPAWRSKNRPVARGCADMQRGPIGPFACRRKHKYRYHTFINDQRSPFDGCT
jgi:hypothetical protein